MHYVSGHEVAQQLTAEVYQLAFSPTKAWNKRTDMTYMCQIGGMIALKLEGTFDCSPEMMLEIIIERQLEWDLNARELRILEEYDTYNKILLLTLQIPALDKISRICLYRCIVPNYITKQFHIVYQSIDHDKIPPDDMVITCAPSGYFISPVEGNKNRCKVTSIFQFPADGNTDNPLLLAALCSSSERIIAAFRGAALRSNENSDTWNFAIINARKGLYNRMHDHDASNGWSLRVHHAGLRMYTRSYLHGEFFVSTRTSFSLPYPSHIVAQELFESFQNIREWDSLVTWAEPLEFVRENAYLRRFAYSDMQDGSPITAVVFCCIHILKDNICDLAYKLSVQDKLPTPIGCIHGSMPSSGFIINPTSTGCTVQYLMQTCYHITPPDTMLRRESARLIHHLHALLNHVTKRLRDQNPGESEEPEKPLKQYPVMVKHEHTPYIQATEEFSRMLLRHENDPAAPTILSSNAPTSIPKTPLISSGGSRAKSKRKLNSSTLRNVEDVVLKSPKQPDANMGTPTKPFLFLVSDTVDGSTHRFVPRRRGSPISQSNFDLLPQEILLEVFMFLEPASLGNIAHTCALFKDIIASCQLWRTLYTRVWGTVRGRVARRYCGDDDPSTFFSPTSFSDWKELFMERQYIEVAWENPARRALSFSVTKAHSRTVRSMALLPARHRLVTGSQDRIVRVWDVTSGACLLAMQGVSSCVSVHAWDDAHVKVGYKDGTVRVFDIMSEECASEIRLGEPMRGCIFTNNSVIAWQDNVVHWDETTQQPIATFDGHAKRVKSCALSPDKSLLYTASRDTVVRIWDLHNQIKISSIEGHSRAVNSVENLGSNQCITGSSDHTAKVWDIRKLSSALHVIKAHSGKVKCIQYSDIGNKICTGGEDGVNIWRGDNFSHIRRDSYGEIMTTLVMDEESIAYGGMNGSIQFYDFAPHR